LLTGEGEGGGLGAESYDCKKAWSSINHSILSVVERFFLFLFYKENGGERGKREELDVDCIKRKEIKEDKRYDKCPLIMFLSTKLVT
jgi:hypothetical protein